MPGPPALTMADTYAVVQKRGAPAGTGAGARGRCAEEAPLYSQVMSRAQRPQAHAEDARGLLPGRGESGPGRAGAGLGAKREGRHPPEPSPDPVLLGSGRPWRPQGAPPAPPTTPPPSPAWSGPKLTSVRALPATPLGLLPNSGHGQKRVPGLALSPRLGPFLWRR